MFSGLPILGWAKPVPVNISRLRHHRRDFMIVAAAGPISNFLQAFVIAAVFRRSTRRVTSIWLPAILRLAVETNLLLAFFNLIPIPPLDGGNVLAGLVPESAARVIDQVRQFGIHRALRADAVGRASRAHHAADGVLLRLLLL